MRNVADVDRELHDLWKGSPFRVRAFWTLVGAGSIAASAYDWTHPEHGLPTVLHYLALTVAILSFLNLWALGAHVLRSATKEKNLLPGIKRDTNGRVVFDLSREEWEYVQKTIGPGPPTQTEIEYWHSPAGSALPEQMRATLADALWHYAGEQVILARSARSESKIEECLGKATAAVMKATHFYPLPGFTFDLACFSDLRETLTGKREEITKRLFANFLSQQQSFKPSQLANEVTQRNWDISEAIKFAESKLR